MQLLTFSFAILTFLLNFGVAEKNLVCRKFGMCNTGIDYPSKIYATFKNINGMQIMSANMSLSQDLGDDTMVYMTFSFNGDRRILVNETFCKMTRSYVGPFMDDLRKAAQILPGTCPIPKGKYRIVDLPLNLNKMFLKALIPNGKLHFVGHNINLKSGVEIICYEAEIEVL